MNRLLLAIALCFCTVTVISCNSAQSPTCACDAAAYPRQLTSSGRDHIPYWAPGGGHIAFLSQRNTYDPYVAAIRFELWIMEKDGSNQRPIVTDDDLFGGSGASGRGVSWAPDSQEMLVQISAPQGSEIWRVSLDASKMRLSSPDDWAGQPQYSPDGLKAALLIRGPDSLQGSGACGLYVANSDLSNPVLVEQGFYEGFAWSPDSQGLIYSLYDRASENFDLWACSATGTGKRRVSATPHQDEEDPSYSTDARHTVFSGQNGVYVTSSHTFDPREVLHNARLPRWVPNRDLLLVVCEQTLDYESYWTESWVVDLGGTILEKIAEGKPTWVDFSPDGRHLVYSLDGNLWLDCMSY